MLTIRIPSYPRKMQTGVLIISSILFLFSYLFYTVGAVYVVPMFAFLISSMTYLIKDRKAKLSASISMFFCLYTLIGVSNLSAWRGYIIPEIQLMFFFALNVVAFTIFIVTFILRDSNSSLNHLESSSIVRDDGYYISTYVKTWSRPVIAAMLVPSVLAARSIIQDKGLDLGQNDRFGTSPVYELSILFVFVPLSLSVYNIKESMKTGRWTNYFDLLVVLWSLAATIILGYRNSIIGVFVCFVSIMVKDFSIKKLSLLFVIGIAIILIFDQIRRIAFPNLLDVESLQYMFGAEHLPPLLAVLHFTFREGFGTSQHMILTYDGPPQTIFFADLFTILPGYQPSGGGIVAELNGGTLQNGGLTSTLIGLSLFEFGKVGGFIFLIVITSIFSSIINWKIANDPLSDRILTAIPTYEFILLFHRGDMRVSTYVVIPAILIIVALRDNPLLRKPVLISRWRRVPTRRPRLIARSRLALGASTPKAIEENHRGG